MQDLKELYDQNWCDTARILLELSEKKGIVGKPVDYNGNPVEWKDVSNEDLIKGIPFIVEHLNGLKEAYLKEKKK